jgi:Maf1 regulator
MSIHGNATGQYLWSSRDQLVCLSWVCATRLGSDGMLCIPSVSCLSALTGAPTCLHVCLVPSMILAVHMVVPNRMHTSVMICSAASSGATAAGEAANLWAFNFFFYNKKMKRILYLSCRAASKTVADEGEVSLPG